MNNAEIRRRTKISKDQSQTVPNSLRIKVKEGDCLADLLDISDGGAGVEFFDLFDVLIFSEGDLVKLEFLLKPEQVNNENASKILDSIRKHQKVAPGTKEKNEHIHLTEDGFEADAKDSMELLESAWFGIYHLE